MADINPDTVCPHRFNCSSHPGSTSLDIGSLPTYTSLGSSCLSLCGSLLIFLAYFLFRDLRTGAQKVISLLALADFCTALGYVMGGVNFLLHFEETNAEKCRQFHTVCVIQSFVTTWSTMSSYLWTSILAFYFFLVLVFNRATLASRLLPLYNVIAWLAPLTVMLPLLLTDRLGYAPFVASNWCFIKDDRYSSQNLDLNRSVIAMILVGGKLWEILTYVWISALYLIISYTVSKKAKKGIVRTVAGRVEMRLLAIPILYVVCRMWGTLQFFYSLGASPHIHNGCVSRDLHIVFLLFGYFQAVGDGAQGWANAILYIFFSPVLRKRMFADPFHKCLNKAIEQAAHLLESDTGASRVTNHSARDARFGSNHLGRRHAVGRDGVSSNMMSSETVYHSFSSEKSSEESPPPIQFERGRLSSQRSVQGTLSSAFASLPGPTVKQKEAGARRERDRVREGSGMMRGRVLEEEGVGKEGKGEGREEDEDKVGCDTVSREYLDGFWTPQEGIP